MSRRAVPALVLILAGLIGLVVVGRANDDTPRPFFANTGETWMPAVGVSGSLTGSWFCPGVPTADLDDTGGQVVVSNREGRQMEGRFVILTENGVATEETFTVGEWSQTTLDVASRVSDSDFASVVVEIEGGGGFVEQIARHPLGDSVAACSTDTSPTWYFADGYTLETSLETLILTNPFDEPVVADLRFSTENSEARPNQFKGFTVLPRSVRTIAIPELGARNEPVISVSIEATVGRLVAGRAQEFRGGGRFGYDVSLAAPELRDQWWFADGEKGAGIDESYSIYNPTDEAVDVTVFFGGLPLAASGVNERDAITVPPFRVVVYDPSVDTGLSQEFEEDLGLDGGDDDGDDDGDGDGDGDADAAEGDGAEDDDGFVELEGPSSALPDGRHATVFSTLSQPSIVVERVLTRSVDGTIATTTVMGAPPRPDGFVANTWSMGIGPEAPTEDALVIYNIDQAESLVNVSVIGPDGPSAVPSLTDLELPPGGVLTVDLVDPDVLGRELIVSATSRVFIERLLPRNNDLPGRSGSWLLPTSG